MDEVALFLQLRESSKGATVSHLRRLQTDAHIRPIGVVDVEEEEHIAWVTKQAPGVPPTMGRGHFQNQPITPMGGSLYLNRDGEKHCFTGQSIVGLTTAFTSPHLPC